MNHGIIFSGGLRITLDMQKRGDRRGSHRHVQKRPLHRSKPLLKCKEYLRNAGGIVRDTLHREREAEAADVSAERERQLAA